MKLETMQAVVATVNEQWESDLADTLLQAWAHDPERAKYWRASANFIFFFKEAGKHRILRFNHASERTAITIQAEIDYVQMLASQGINVAKPIPSLQGRYVESIDTPQGLFHAVAFEAMPGKQLEFEELTPDQFNNWGKALGELHRTTTGYANTGRPTWRDHLTFVASILPTEEISAWQTLHKLTQQLEQLPITPQNFGLIHYDFELDNILWQGERAGFVDFDDSAAHWFVADIAYALRDLFEDNAAKVDLHNESYQHFVRGYNSMKPVSSEELQHIPLFLRLHHLVTFAKLYRAVPTTPPTDELAWMTELRQKLTAMMQNYRDGFAEYVRSS